MSELTVFETSIVHVGDCIEVMQDFPAACVDLIFADPPYNMRIDTGTIKRPEGGKYEGVKDAWDKFDTWEDYKTFTIAWLQQARRVLKDDGSLWVMGTYHNIFIIGAALMELNWFIINDVIWVKPNPAPQFRGVRFCNSVETLIWAVKYKGCGYTFNYHDMKQYNGGKQMRADWNGISICIGKERLKGSNGKKAHSTQKPEKLLERVLLSTTLPGDIVLDPFFGVGTTGAVAKRFGRKWVGIEQNAYYAQLAFNRIDDV